MIGVSNSGDMDHRAKREGDDTHERGAPNVVMIEEDTKDMSGKETLRK